MNLPAGQHPPVLPDSEDVNRLGVVGGVTFRGLVGVYVTAHSPAKVLSQALHKVVAFVIVFQYLADFCQFNKKRLQRGDIRFNCLVVSLVCPSKL